MKTPQWIVAGLLAAAGLLPAPSATITDTPTDSIVQITAEAEGLTRVDLATLPLFAACRWTVCPNGGPVPLPCPPEDLTVPIYEITPGVYLVDETGGSVSIPASGVSASTVTAAVERQGTAIANLIEQVQATQTVQVWAMASSLAVPMPGDGSSSTNTGTANETSYVAPDYGTNLWIATVWIATVGVDSNG